MVSSSVHTKHAAENASPWSRLPLPGAASASRPKAMAAWKFLVWVFDPLLLMFFLPWSSTENASANLFLTQTWSCVCTLRLAYMWTCIVEVASAQLHPLVGALQSFHIFGHHCMSTRPGFLVTAPRFL